MSEAFWWYVLAGFLLGFSVSTLWEWLYFRRRRMAIQDRRIAELEATVRTYTAAANAPSDDGAADDWAEPAFQSPGVYLETEEAPTSAAQPETLPAAQKMAPAATVVVASTLSNGAQTPAPQPARVASNNYVAYSSPAPAGFQSLAVQQSSPPVSASIEDAPPVDNDSRFASVLTALGAAAVVQHVTDDSTSEPVEAPAPAVDAPTITPAPVYVNGVTSALAQETASGAALDHDNRTITSAEIGVLVSSINDLIDTVNQEPKAEHLASSPSQAAPLASAGDDDPYVTRINGRAEYVLVRMVQSVMQFMRELRGILTGAQNGSPALRPAPVNTVGDDLTQIAGLNAEQADRLRTAGVTTYARLTELSPDELRLITLTPDGVAADPGKWQAQAQHLLQLQPEGGRA
jgi:hypothetical protein